MFRFNISIAYALWLPILKDVFLYLQFDIFMSFEFILVC